MGARWYNPATGSFGNKDTVANKPVPDSASASPFGYAADNPLGPHRPHRPLCHRLQRPADPGRGPAGGPYPESEHQRRRQRGARQAAAAARTARWTPTSSTCSHLARLATAGQARQGGPHRQPHPRPAPPEQRTTASPTDPSAFTPCPALGNSCLALTHENNQNRQARRMRTGPSPFKPAAPAETPSPRPPRSAPAKHVTPVDSPRPPSGGNPLSGVKSLIGAGATALLSGIVGGGASISEAEINALLGTSGTEALAKLHSAIGDLANKSPSELEKFLNPEEIAAVQKKEGCRLVCAGILWHCCREGRRQCRHGCPGNYTLG